MRHVIISIHGIRWNSNREWQADLEKLVRQQNANAETKTHTKVYSFRYGHILGIFSWFISLTEAIGLSDKFVRAYVDAFYKFILNVYYNELDNDNDEEIKMHIIAHSYGTWILNEMFQIEKYRAAFEDLKMLNNIVSVQGVTTSKLEDSIYPTLLRKGIIKRFVAWSSHNDEVVYRIAIPPFGHIGYWGHIRPGNLGDKRLAPYKPIVDLELFNTVTSEDHNGVLSKLNFYFKHIINDLTGTKLI